MEFGRIAVHVLFFLNTQIDNAYSSVFWNMTTYPAVFGNDVVLTCYIVHPLQHARDCTVRQWSGGSDGRGLMYNGFSANEKKYEEKANLLSSQFSLIISNFSTTDINVNYTCSCGFYASTHTLQLDEKHFQYLPDAPSASITSYNDTLKIKMQIRKVYPLPNCTVYVGIRVVANKVQFNYRKSGLFYNVSFVEEYKLVDADCNKQPRIQCELKTEQIKFVGNITSSCPVFWNMTTYPAVFGKDVILTCYTVHPLQNSRDCPVRQWSGGSDGRSLMYNGFSANEKKYEEKANLLSCQFSLIIRNFSTTDINVNYTCSCGLYASTHTLQLDEKRFQYSPDADAANASITSYNDTFKIKMQIRKVYPLPNCSVYIGNRLVSKQVRLTHRKSGLFYNVSFVEEYKLVDADCNKQPRIQCELKTEQIKFVGNITSSCPDYSSETSVNENTSPIEESFNKKTSSHHDITVVIVACVCALLVVFVVLGVVARIKYKQWLVINRRQILL